MPFASLIECAEDEGAIGQVLRQIPRDIVDEAQKRHDPWTWLADWVATNPLERTLASEARNAAAMCGWLTKEGFKRTSIGVYSADSRVKHRLGSREFRFYKHKHDPGKICMRQIADSAWPDSFRKVFLAAASQRKAFHRLSRMARGEATLMTDWLVEMKNAEAAGNRKRLERAMNKLALARAPYDFFHADAQNHPDPDIRKSSQKFIGKWHQEAIKRGRRNEAKLAKPLPRASEVRTKFKLPFLLAQWWVRCGESPVPGLMFWRNEAITKYLKAVLDQANLTTGAVKKVRQRLQLFPVSRKAPWIWDVTLRRHHETSWHVVGTQRDGARAFAFTGKIFFNKRPLLPPVNLPL